MEGRDNALTIYNQIRTQVLSTVGAAVILALLAAAWQLVAHGGLISALGGATKDDLKLISPLPTGAVVAFDLPEGCPKGWSNFTDGQSRTIVGAKVKGVVTPEEDGLTQYKFRQTGGKENHTLVVNEMPTHTHDVNDPGHKHRVAGGFSARDRDNDPGGGELTNGALARGNHYSQESPTRISIEPRGDGKPHPNMPPFIPLYLCKRI